MGIFHSKKIVEAPNPLACAACEKVQDKDEDLTYYIAKKYCPDCISALKQNKRRTTTNVRESILINTEKKPTAVLQTDLN